MRQGALGGLGARDSISGLAKELARGEQRRMIRQRLLRSGCGQHQQSRKLRGNLLQIFKTFLIFDNVRCGRVVYHEPSTLSTPDYRITNGFGALPAMSIQTLLV